MALLALTARHLRADLRLSSGDSPSIQNVPDQKTYLSIYFRGLGGARNSSAVSAISAVSSKRHVTKAVDSNAITMGAPAQSIAVNIEQGDKK